MQLLMLLFVVGLVSGFIAALVVAVTRVNRQSEARYGIRPISWGRAFLMVVPYAVLGLGWFLDAGRSNDNFVVAVGCAVLVTIGVFWWIAAKTDAPTAAASIALLMLLGLMLAVLIFIVLGGLFGSGEEDRRRGSSYHAPD